MPRSTASGTSLEDESNAGWIDRQTHTPEARRLYEQERLALWVSEALAQAMAESGLSKADLAERLGTSRAHITQVLSGSRNMTLRTVADLAWACNQRAEFQMDPLEAVPKRGDGKKGKETGVAPSSRSRERQRVCGTTRCQQTTGDRSREESP